MEEKRYIISEAVQKTGIEAHVLRYWEEELGLNIPRNEMGHRYYTENQLKMFMQIRDLKQSGFQLKAVKNVIESEPIYETNEGTVIEDNKKESVDSELVKDEPTKIKLSNAESKLEQFEQIIGDIVTRSLLENNVRLGENISGLVSDQVSNKVIKEMDYLMRVKEESEEERYKRLDETIRGMQRSNKEAAAYKEKKEKRKKRLFF